MPEIFEALEWKTILLGGEKWSFLFETAIRTLAMFIAILLGLRLLGKRGVKQLSVFEMGVIIGLGSAAGDPMFYKDVGLIPGMLVFAIVISLYRFITFLINRSTRFERFMEGKPTCLVDEGKFLVENFRQEPIAMDEFFSQLRLRSVSHLGQVQQAIIETAGEISVFFYPDEEVKHGLPIIPALCVDKLTAIPAEGHYACTYCGNTVKLSPAPERVCTRCQKKEWLKAINSKRIS
jgi:uncharacterized membrane protein YcaP (DUF421 family)